MPKRKLPSVPNAYSHLLTKVKQTLIEGQQRIEAARVRTYWETGRLINSHVLKHGNGVEYGNEVVLRLANDLQISETVLYRCVKFVEKYPDFKKVAARPLFSWSHYRKLIAIEDDKKRLAFEKAASHYAWSSDELAARIEADRSLEVSEPEEKRLVSQKLLTPLRGQLYTYRLVERPNLGAGESGLLLDLGFGIFHNVDSRQPLRFASGDIVVSIKKSESDAPSSAKGASEELPQYRLKKTDRTPKDLFTYNAYVERVIDGDTIKVRFDLGFDTWYRETLRLRDIDCPEMDTKAGQEAKAFVQSLIKEASWIVVRSSRSDKYDRYLADVFIPHLENLGLDKDAPRRAPLGAGVTSRGVGGAEEIYLNNLLFEKGYAKRV